MATKKITELQLISSITGTENLPADNGLQTYRCTPAQLKAYILANQNILLAMLKDDIFSGLTTVTAADDDYFPLIDASDSNKTKKALVGSFVRTKYRAVSSYPASITSTDGTLKLSGSSGTITLPATGNPGTRYKLIHAGTNFTQVYTVATTGGAVFKGCTGDVASGSLALYTKGEVFEFEDDGTDWLIVNHWAQTDWIDMGAMTIDVISGTNPTKPSSVNYDKVWAKRRGNTVDLRYRYRHTNNTGSATGSGKYRWLIPFTVDTNAFPVSTATDFATGSDVVSAYGANIGYGAVAIASSTNGPVTNIALYDSTHFTVKTMQLGGPNLAQIDNDYFDLNKATLAYSFDIFNLAISGWYP